MSEDKPEYSTHKDQILSCGPTPERVAQLEKDLLQAFKRVITYREVPFIRFGDLNVTELAAAFHKYPIIIKPTLTCVNVAQRAIKRDLGLDIDTYSTSVLEAHATELAGYLKPLLPPEIAVPALLELDRFFWTDKEMRAQKGNWEKAVTESINQASKRVFKKRRFECDGEKFEIDAAYPTTGLPIEIAVDVKRIESPRDIHKRADEVINKAGKFRRVFPRSKFFALVYYPFPTQHLNVKSRLSSPNIDGVYFAGQSESSIRDAIDLLLGAIGLAKEQVDSSEE